MSRGDFDVVPIRGGYRVRKAGGVRGGDRQHVRFAAAEEEALRLAAANPGSTFIITREVARVQEHKR